MNEKYWSIWYEILSHVRQQSDVCWRRNFTKEKWDQKQKTMILISKLLNISMHANSVNCRTNTVFWTSFRIYLMILCQLSVKELRKRADLNKVEKNCLIYCHLYEDWFSQLSHNSCICFNSVDCIFYQKNINHS